jgi:tetratricopeptide (TPR) repeat protein
MLYKLADLGLLINTPNGIVISNRMADYARSMGSLEKEDVLQQVTNAWEAILNSSLKTADVLLQDYADIAHLKVAFIAAISHDIKNIGFMMYFLGRHYQQKKAFPLAEYYLLKAFDLDKEQYGLDHLKVGIVLNALGNLFYQEHKLYKAGGCYTKALPILIRNFDRDHPLVVALQNNLDELGDYLTDGII